MLDNYVVGDLSKDNCNISLAYSLQCCLLQTLKILEKKLVSELTAEDLSQCGEKRERLSTLESVLKLYYKSKIFKKTNERVESLNASSLKFGI